VKYAKKLKLFAGVVHHYVNGEPPPKPVSYVASERY
jgi:hypothetical protein